MEILITVIFVVILTVFGFIGFRQKFKDKKLFNEKKIPSKNWVKILYHSAPAGHGGTTSGYSYLKLSDGKTFSIAGKVFTPIVQIKQTFGGDLSATYQKTFTSTSTSLSELSFNNQIYYFMIDENKTKMSVKINNQDYSVPFKDGNRLGDTIMNNNTSIAQINRATENYTEIIFNIEQINFEVLFILSFLVMSEHLA